MRGYSLYNGITELKKKMLENQIEIYINLINTHRLKSKEFT